MRLRKDTAILGAVSLLLLVGVSSVYAAFSLNATGSVTVTTTTSEVSTQGVFVKSGQIGSTSCNVASNSLSVNCPTTTIVSTYIVDANGNPIGQTPGTETLTITLINTTPSSVAIATPTVATGAGGTIITLTPTGTVPTTIAGSGGTAVFTYTVSGVVSGSTLTVGSDTFTISVTE